MLILVIVDNINWQRKNSVKQKRIISADQKGRNSWLIFSLPIIFNCYDDLSQLVFIIRLILSLNWSIKTYFLELPLFYNCNYYGDKNKKVMALHIMPPLRNYVVISICSYVFFLFYFVSSSFFFYFL